MTLTAARASTTSGHCFDVRPQELAATPTFVPHPRIAERARLKLARVSVAEPTDAGLIASLLEYFDSEP